jgi:hypothetical protein
LEITSGIDVPGELRQSLALSLFVAWCIVFLCVLYGIKSSGKVSFTHTLGPNVAADDVIETLDDLRRHLELKKY